MNLSHWTTTFRAHYDQALERYRSGEREAANIVDEAGREFLATIGLRPIFLLDHAEDFERGGDPDYDTTLLIAAARRDFFRIRQAGQWTDREFDLANLPAREAEMEGVRWLPRIIDKARGFLEGNLPEDIMYYCGGDRRFLAEQSCHPADFLRMVESSGSSAGGILKLLKKRPMG